MKAISLWQPWATLAAIGAKRFETRGWSTRYRGPLVIHAAKHRDRKIDRWAFGECAPVRAALAGVGILFPDDLPLGCVLGTVELSDCLATESVVVDRVERELGDFRAGRFAWKLEQARIFSEPIPATGRQWIWEWEYAPFAQAPAFKPLPGQKTLQFTY